MGRYVIDNLPQAIDLQEEDWVRRTVQNCKNLLMCHMGEVPCDRMRGLNPGIYDMGIDEVNAALLKELDRVMAWEPEAEVVSAEAKLLQDNSVYIRCVIEVYEGE